MRRASVLGLALMASLVFVVWSPAGAVRAEFCGPVDPLHLWEARGNVFLADVVSRHAGQYDGFTFDILTVFDHRDPLPSGILGEPLVEGHRVAIYAQSSCDAPKLQVGARYLISTHDLHPLSTAWTAVWRVHGTAVTLVRSFPERAPAAALLRPQTVSQAVALMTDGLPQTDAVARPASAPEGPIRPWSVAIAVGLVWFAWRRRIVQLPR